MHRIGYDGVFIGSRESASASPVSASGRSAALATAMAGFKLVAMHFVLTVWHSLGCWRLRARAWRHRMLYCTMMRLKNELLARHAGREWYRMVPLLPHAVTCPAHDQSPRANDPWLMQSTRRRRKTCIHSFLSSDSPAITWSQITTASTAIWSFGARRYPPSDVGCSWP